MNQGQTTQSLPWKLQQRFRVIGDIVAGLKSPPTARELQYLWDRTFELFEDYAGNAKALNALKRDIKRYLFAKAPFLAPSPGALKKLFNRKFAAWVQGGRKPSATADGRKSRSGNFRGPNVTQDDIDQVIMHALFNCGGRVSQAWRELLDRNHLSEQIMGYYLHNPASKSYVPTRIRKLVQNEVRLLDDIHHGPRQHKLNGAYLFRNWSGVHAGDWYQADDVTCPVYWYEPNGKGWYRLMRGQLLLMIDCRSTRILAYALIPEESYNSRAIRTLITKTCDEHGLPRKGFYFENGIWRNSRLIKGHENADVSWAEAEVGLREMVRFVHSRLPRSKPVERVIGALQNYMEGEPGYCGRNERSDRYERFEKLKRQIESKKISPVGLLYSFEQWDERLDQLCAQYNAERQCGEMLDGLSPEEGFQKFDDAGDPPTRLCANSRYLLAHHRRPVQVTKNGITLRFGKQVFNYRNETTGRLIGTRVLAWFNPEVPEILSVTDMKRENPFCVERSQRVAAMDEQPGVLAHESERITAHQSYALTRYRSFKVQWARQFRRPFGSPDIETLGKQMGAQRAEAETRIKEHGRAVQRGRRVSEGLGTYVPQSTLRRPEAVAALERLSEMLQEDSEKEAL